MTSTFLKKILITLKMEGIGQLLPPKLALLRFSTNMFSKVLLMLERHSRESKSDFSGQL